MLDVIVVECGACSSKTTAQYHGKRLRNSGAGDPICFVAKRSRIQVQSHRMYSVRVADLATRKLIRHLNMSSYWELLLRLAIHSSSCSSHLECLFVWWCSRRLYRVKTSTRQDKQKQDKSHTIPRALLLQLPRQLFGRLNIAQIGTKSSFSTRTMLLCISSALRVTAVHVDLVAP